MRIRFLSEQVYEQGGPNKGPRFPKGFVLDEADVQGVLGLAEPPSEDWLSGFMNRWLQRKVAEVVDGRTPQSDLLETAKGDHAPLPAELGKLTRADLDQLARSRGVDVSDAKNKGDVIAALQLAAEKN
jgi:hypothetical protein